MKAIKEYLDDALPPQVRELCSDREIVFPYEQVEAIVNQIISDISKPMLLMSEQVNQLEAKISELEAQIQEYE